MKCAQCDKEIQDGKCIRQHLILGDAYYCSKECFMKRYDDSFETLTCEECGKSPATYSFESCCDVFHYYCSVECFIKQEKGEIINVEKVTLDQPETSDVGRT